MSNGYPTLRRERFVERIINLAPIPINLYEDSTGRIFHFDFCKAPTVDFEKNEADKSDTRSKIYAVDQDLLNYFQKEGYPLEDVAVISEISKGRHGKDITRLVLARNREIVVRLRVN